MRDVVDVELVEGTNRFSGRLGNLVRRWHAVFASSAASARKTEREPRRRRPVVSGRWALRHDAVSKTLGVAGSSGVTNSGTAMAPALDGRERSQRRSRSPGGRDRARSTAIGYPLRPGADSAQLPGLASRSVRLTRRPRWWSGMVSGTPPNRRRWRRYARSGISKRHPGAARPAAGVQAVLDRSRPPALELWRPAIP